MKVSILLILSLMELSTLLILSQMSSIAAAPALLARSDILGDNPPKETANLEDQIINRGCKYNYCNKKNICLIIILSSYCYKLLLINSHYYFIHLSTDVPLENCKAIQDSGFNKTGLYKIQPNGAIGEFTVFCDMTLFEGGWTVLQRRIDSSVDFYRKFSSYRNGFGNFFENFWLGLTKIYQLTHNMDNIELYVGLEIFEGETDFAHYSSFAVDNEDAGYTSNKRV